MRPFIITYDNKPPRNYAPLYVLMASWNAKRLADSVWLANLTGDVRTIRNIIQSKLQWDDVVAVIELQAGSDWATSNVDATANGWLSANIRPGQKAA